jgi:hypothetical protein
MTIIKRLLVTIDEIKMVRLTCTKCETVVSFMPSAASVPNECRCSVNKDALWFTPGGLENQNINSLLKLIGDIKKQIPKNAPYKLELEFEQPLT